MCTVQTVISVRGFKLSIEHEINTGNPAYLGFLVLRTRVKDETFDHHLSPFSTQNGLGLGGLFNFGNQAPPAPPPPQPQRGEIAFRRHHGTSRGPTTLESGVPRMSGFRVVPETFAELQ